MVRPQGFTLVELVMTMVVVGIMAAYAVPRLGSMAIYDLTNAAHELVEAVRFAQETTMVRVDSSLEVVTNSGTDYRVQEYNHVTTTTANISSPLTGSSPYRESGDIWNNIAVSSASISFDSRGYPCAMVAPCSTRMTTAQTIVLTHTSGESKSITIEPISGFVHVN